MLSRLFSASINMVSGNDFLTGLVPSSLRLLEFSIFAIQSNMSMHGPPVRAAIGGLSVTDSSFGCDPPTGRQRIMPSLIVLPGGHWHPECNRDASQFEGNRTYVVAPRRRQWRNADRSNAMSIQIRPHRTAFGPDCAREVQVTSLAAFAETLEVSEYGGNQLLPPGVLGGQRSGKKIQINRLIGHDCSSCVRTRSEIEALACHFASVISG